MLPLLILVELHLLSKSKSARPSQAAEDHKGKKSVETPKGTPKKAKETKETKDHAKDQLISRTRKQQGSVVAWGPGLLKYHRVGGARARPGLLGSSWTRSFDKPRRTGWARQETQGRRASVSQDDCGLNSPRNFAPAPMGAPGNFSVLNNRTRINYRACSLLVLLGQHSIFTSAIPRRPRDAVLFVAPKGLSSSSISFTSISASYHRRHQRLHAKRKRFLSDDFLDLGDDRFPLLDPYKYTFDPSTLNRALRTTTLTTSQKFLGLLATAALIGAIAISPDLADPEKVWNFPFFGLE